MPIDYWDYLGWKDTLADSRFSARQKAYSHMRGDREVYTPQVVVNGGACVGSDRAGIESAIERTRKTEGVMSVPVTMTLSRQADQCFGGGVQPGPAAMHGEVWICSVSKAVPISIGRGENRGREITYHNVVRNLLKVGDWNGSPGSWTVPLENISRDGVDAAAVYVQDGNRDKPGSDARRGLHAAALTITFPVDSACARSARTVATVCDSGFTALRERRSTARIVRRARLGSSANAGSPKRKRTNFRWPSMGIIYPANRPDPDDPGGLGAEESGAERTGSTQDYLLATQQGGRLAEVGRYYDFANDPVTLFPP